MDQTWSKLELYPTGWPSTAVNMIGYLAATGSQSITAGMMPNAANQVCLMTKRYLVTEAFFVYGKGVATQIPYRNLNYKALKFAMVLSSLNIQELNVSRRSLVFMLQGISWLNSSSIECRTRWRSCNLVVAGSHLSQRALFSLLQCCFQAYSSWGSKC